VEVKNFDIIAAIAVRRARIADETNLTVLTDLEDLVVCATRHAGTAHAQLTAR
jgi:hypothetical protein